VTQHRGNWFGSRDFIFAFLPTLDRRGGGGPCPLLPLTRGVFSRAPYLLNRTICAKSNVVELHLCLPPKATCCWKQQFRRGEPLLEPECQSWPFRALAWEDELLFPLRCATAQYNYFRGSTGTLSLLLLAALNSWAAGLMDNIPSKVRMRNTTRPFVQWNLVLAHLQHSNFNIVYISHSPCTAWNVSLVVCLRDRLRT